MSNTIYGTPVGTPISPKKIEEVLNPVKTVNGQAPDENGNVEIEVSGSGSCIYIGSGEMPEGYNVQIDPEGEVVDLANLPTSEDMKEAIDNALKDFEPETSGGGIEVSGAEKEWTLIKTVTTTEQVNMISVSGFEVDEIFAELSIGYVSGITSNYNTATVTVTGTTLDGKENKQLIPGITSVADTINEAYDVCVYGNGAFAIAFSNKGANLGGTVYGQGGKDCGLSVKIKKFAVSHAMNAGRFIVGSTVKLYGR